MDKIKIEDLANPPVVTRDKTGEIKEPGNLPVKKIKKKKISFPDKIKEMIANSPLPGLIPLLKKFNIYRKIRESLVAFYLSKTTGAEKKNLTISWQPPLFIFFKIAVVAFISFKLYELHPVVGTWLKNGLDFFKLHEIYNFKFPSKSFFDTVASYLFLFVIGYHGIYFLYHQVLGLFSVLVINKTDEKVYYIRNFFIKKDLFIFSIPDIALVVLKQNVISRLFGLGTISFQKRSGEQVVIRTIQHAHLLLKDLTQMKKDSVQQEAGE
ncbi:MAG: PH domain-containing protein [Spirochaetales bacterium]|nr:PH domain-containing protein [Spirochaetales bacterium]